MRVLSTDQLPGPERFALWRDMVADMTMPIDVRSEYADDFNAIVESATLGTIEVLNMRQSSIAVDRGRRLIRRSDPETVHLVLSLTGEQRIAHDRGDVLLRPGDMTMYSSSRPFRTYPQPDLGMERAVVLVMPRAMLPVPAGRLEELMVVRFDPSEPLEGLVSAHMQGIARNLRFQQVDAPRLSSITMELVGMMLAHRLSLDARVGAQPHDEVMLARVQGFIDQFLSDAGLTPEAVAAAHHLSLRSLQRLFHQHGMTVAGWIRHRRLTRCHRDLADPRLRSVPIQAIAAQWGFSQPAHFSRVFKQAYGIGPREFRETST